MKSLLIVAALWGVLAVSAHGQVTGFLESYNSVSAAGVTPEFRVYVRGPLAGKFGWSAWTLTSKPYSEAYGGLTYAPSKWLEVSGGVGLETAEKPLRIGGSAWVGKERWSLLSIHEYGGSGYWYRHTGTYRIAETLTAGVDSTRFLGTGPYIEKKFGKLALWGSYAVGHNKGVAGVKLNF